MVTIKQGGIAEAAISSVIEMIDSMINHNLFLIAKCQGNDRTRSYCNSENIYNECKRFQIELLFMFTSNLSLSKRGARNPFLSHPFTLSSLLKEK
jgi:hypothetical protein